MKPVEETRTRTGTRKVQSRSMELKIKRNATIEDLADVPEGHNGQLIDGVLYITTRPANMHALAITELHTELGPFARDRRNGWVVLFEPVLLIGKNVLIGDLAGWRRERMPTVPADKWFELAPDFVCEALSPSTARIDRGRKREIYGAAKVGHVWFIDPIHLTLEVLALQKRGGYNVVASAGATDRGRFPPFEDLEIDLSVLFQP
jgi:Uma2 family endonuclease